jgi:hypothetical protein
LFTNAINSLMKAKATTKWIRHWNS